MYMHNTYIHIHTSCFLIIFYHCPLTHIPSSLSLYDLSPVFSIPSTYFVYWSALLHFGTWCILILANQIISLCMAHMHSFMIGKCFHAPLHYHPMEIIHYYNFIIWPSNNCCFSFWCLFAYWILYWDLLVAYLFLKPHD